MKKQLQLLIGVSLIVVVAVILVLLYASRTQARVNNAAEVRADARATYSAKCAKCHGNDGRGKTFRGKRTHARDLTEAQWQNDVTDERLFNSISNGRNKMPGFKKQLSEGEIDALVAYVRRFKK